jgi:acetolactate synthase I/II/III large subunit
MPLLTHDVTTITAVELLLRYLKEEGVDYIFGIPGGPLMPLYEAVFKTKFMTPILTKHEQGAAFMADGYARVSGKIGACCVTAGPGCTNAVTGMAVSYADGIPVFLITAQVATTAFGRGAMQESTPFEVDIVELLKPVTRASMMLIRSEKMAETLRHLFRVAKDRNRGPVHLNLPADLAKRAVTYEPYHGGGFAAPRLEFDRESIRAASQWLLRAKHPAILVGNGVNFSGAHEELKTLSEKLLIPVATTAKAKGVFSEDHVLSLGVFGFAGSPRSDAYLLSGDVDVLLAIGTGLNENATSGWDKRLNPKEAFLQIDIDPKKIGKNYQVTVPLVGDAKAVLTELLYQIDRDAQWLESRRRSLFDIKQFRARVPRCVDEMKMSSDAVPIKPQRLMKDLNEALPQNAIIFSDMGNHMAWAFHYLQLCRPQSFYHCLGFASMGYGTVAPIGAKLAAPDRPVVSIIGDGSFAMNGMEIHTATEYGIPVVWIVENNGGHGMVYMGENLQFGGRFHCSLFQRPMDICKMAEAMGAQAFHVDKPGEIGSALSSAIASNKPTVINVVIDAEEVPPFGARMAMLDSFFAGNGNHA